MITHSRDIGLEKICKDLNIEGYKMHDYYIYGMRQESRPHVKIYPKVGTSLKKLFARSPYMLEVTNINSRYCESCDEIHTQGDCCCDDECNLCNGKEITIGLRRDIRKSPKIARKLLKTIIFAMEGKLIVGKKSKLKLGKKVRVTATTSKKVVKKPEVPSVQIIPMITSQYTTIV